MSPTPHSDAVGASSEAIHANFYLAQQYTVTDTKQSQQIRATEATSRAQRSDLRISLGPRYLMPDHRRQ